MPQLRDIWPEWKNDDRFWVQAARDARAPRAAEERTVMQERKIETRRGIKCRVLEAGQGAPLVFFHGAGRAPRGGAAARGARGALPRVRAGVAGLRRRRRRGEARGHARLRAARLGRGRGARPRAQAEPGRALDGRHDRGRDGVPRDRRAREAGAPGAGRDLARRAPDPGPLLDAAVRARRGAVRRSQERREVPHRRDRLHQPGRAARSSWSATRAGSAPRARSCSRSRTAGSRSGCTACRRRRSWSGATRTS